MMKTSLTGLSAASKDLSVISNNLANASTAGFKRSSAHFQDMMPGDGFLRPNLEIGRGARVVEISRSTAQGVLTETAGSLDMAIAGPGYFVLGSASSGENETSLVYSRAGRMVMDDRGRIVDSDGNTLLGFQALAGNVIGGEPQPIDLLSAVGGRAASIASVSISEQGKVVVTTADGRNIPVATLALADFPNGNGLKNVGSSKLAESVTSGPARFSVPGGDGVGNIKQGVLEASNVDIADELLGMVRAQQAYNGNARALQTQSEMLRTATETLIR